MGGPSCLIPISIEEGDEKVIDRLAEGFIEGLVAGYGIAIPVGAISLLILKTSLAQGLVAGIAAGAGAASVDFFFAALAVIAGEFLTELLLPIHTPLRILSGAFLILLGAWGIFRLRDKVRRSGSASSKQFDPLRIYFQFLTLTSLNPHTLVYFSALILGGDTADEPAGRIAFVLGAGVASLSWQSFLALLGAKAMGRFNERFQRATVVFGNLIVIAIGLGNLL